MSRIRIIEIAAAACALGLLWQVATADVLITRSGSRYEGKVTDKGGFYVLTTAAGGEMSFPKSMVKEVIRPEQFRPQYQRMLETADLADDAQLEKLLDFAGRGGLTEERKKLLAKAYQLRTAKAGDDPKAWRELGSWCKRHGMKAETDACELQANKSEFKARLGAAGEDGKALEKLAVWCRQRGLREETARCLSGEYQGRRKRAETVGQKWELARWCRQWGLEKWRDQNQLDAITAVASAGDLARLNEFLLELETAQQSAGVARACARAIYRIRVKSAGNEAMALAGLATWCRAHGLKAEAAEAEAAALKIAPTDRKVRESLGHVWDESQSKWVQWDWPWRAKVVEGETSSSYADQSGIRISSKGAHEAVATIQVQFEAMSPEPGGVKACLAQAKPFLSEKLLKLLERDEATWKSGLGEGRVQERLLKDKEWLKEPQRLFLSSMVRLKLGGTAEFQPIFTDRPPGNGCTVFESGKHDERFSTPRSVWARLSRGRSSVLSYVRVPKNTAMLVQPRQKVLLTLVYVIPQAARTATLVFYDLPPIPFDLKSDPRQPRFRESDPVRGRREPPRRAPGGPRRVPREERRR